VVPLARRFYRRRRANFGSDGPARVPPMPSNRAVMTAYLAPPAVSEGVPAPRVSWVVWVGSTAGRLTDGEGVPAGALVAGSAVVGAATAADVVAPVAPVAPAAATELLLVAVVAAALLDEELDDEPDEEDDEPDEDEPAEDDELAGVVPVVGSEVVVSPFRTAPSQLGAEAFETIVSAAATAWERSASGSGVYPAGSEPSVIPGF